MYLLSTLVILDIVVLVLLCTLRKKGMFLIVPPIILTPLFIFGVVGFIFNDTGYKAKSIVDFIKIIFFFHIFSLAEVLIFLVCWLIFRHSDSFSPVFKRTFYISYISVGVIATGLLFMGYFASFWPNSPIPLS